MTEKARKLFGAVGTARRWKARPDTVSSYLEFCGRIADKAEASLAELERAGASEAETASIRRFLDHARRQIDQVDRRLLKGEAIPHDEKVFPVFEEHTRWISKGKAGCLCASSRTGTGSSSNTESCGRAAMSTSRRRCSNPA